MKLSHLTDTVAVAGQLWDADLADLQRQGYAAVINNRPDGEIPGQPTAAHLRAVAQRHGLAYWHIPVVGGQIGPADIASFQQAQADASGAVAAFCRSGQRSAVLWALAEAPARGPGEVMARAAAAGYDLTAVRDRLAAVQAN